MFQIQSVLDWFCWVDEELSSCAWWRHRCFLWMKAWRQCDVNMRGSNTVPFCSQGLIYNFGYYQHKVAITIWFALLVLQSSSWITHYKTLIQTNQNHLNSGHQFNIKQFISRCSAHPLFSLTRAAKAVPMYQCRVLQFHNLLPWNTAGTLGALVMSNACVNHTYSDFTLHNLMFINYLTKYHHRTQSTNFHLQ